MSKMKKRPKVLIMVNWREKGEWDLYQALKRHFDVDVFQPYGGGPWAGGRGWKLSLETCEFYLPLFSCLKRNLFDLVISWSMRFGMVYGLLNRLMPKGSPSHLLYDFHINVERCDWAYKQKLTVTRKAIPGIDFFFTTSRREEALYSTIFHIPRERIRFFPLAPPRPWLKLPSFPVKDYIFAYGNSDRDYDTLLKASRNLSTPLVILSQRYSPNRTYENVTFIRQPVYGLNLAKLVGSAGLVVIPLKSSEVSAGQTAMLETMALGRPIIVTENPATLEYGKHGESAFFYRAGHVEELRNLLESLLKDPDYAESVGRRARVVHSNLPEIRESLLIQTVQGLCGHEP